MYQLKYVLNIFFTHIIVNLWWFPPFTPSSSSRCPGFVSHAFCLLVCLHEEFLFLFLNAHARAIGCSSLNLNCFCVFFLFFVWGFLSVIICFFVSNETTLMRDFCLFVFLFGLIFVIQFSLLFRYLLFYFLFIFSWFLLNLSLNCGFNYNWINKL